MIPEKRVCLRWTAFAFLATAAVLGLTCPPAEELEDWSIHYHRRRVQEEEDAE